MEGVTVIAGNLTADPELRSLADGTNVCGFTIARNTRRWNRQTNQYEDGDTLYMRCTAWRELAAHCAASLSKGVRVVAVGSLRQRTYQTKDGMDRTVTELTVEDIGPSLRHRDATPAPARPRGMQGPPAPPMREDPDDPWI